jgi:predicted acyltransferase
MITLTAVVFPAIAIAAGIAVIFALARFVRQIRRDMAAHHD